MREVRFKDGPLPSIGPGKNGVSVEALKHFREFADIAQKHNIKLVVGLVTGWMSGQLFIPPALEGRKILSDPTSIMWQVKYVTTMVQELKDHPAIIAWNLGNECNCIEEVPSQQAAYVWTASITNAIRAQDKSRPIVTGLHNLTSDTKAKWRMQDQGELLRFADYSSVSVLDTSYQSGSSKYNPYHHALFCRNPLLWRHWR